MKELSGFPTKEEQRDLKRREIVRCAAEKFGNEGYENVPLEAIAAELGVTKAALYNYVSSKNDLLMQCYDVGMDRLVAAETRVIVPPTPLNDFSGNPFGREAMVLDPDGVRIVLFELLVSPDE